MLNVSDSRWLSNKKGSTRTSQADSIIDLPFAYRFKSVVLLWLESAPSSRETTRSIWQQGMELKCASIMVLLDLCG